MSRSFAFEWFAVPTSKHGPREDILFQRSKRCRSYASSALHLHPGTQRLKRSKYDRTSSSELNSSEIWTKKSEKSIHLVVVFATVERERERGAMREALLLLLLYVFYATRLISATVVLKPYSISFPDLPAKFGMFLSPLALFGFSEIHNCNWNYYCIIN